MATATPTPAAEALIPRRGDRLLVLAAHPDDETIATGGVLQRAWSAGAEVSVVFATDGENNPWAQRASEHRFLLAAADRGRFGARRREEALAALERLGGAAAHVGFLGLPDQGLTSLLVGADSDAAAALDEHVGGFRPTTVIAPSAADLHPDHSALAVLLRLALARAAPPIPVRELAYVVHNPELRHHPHGGVGLDLRSEEQERKRSAIACHSTQLHLRGRWLRGFGAATEHFAPVPWPPGAPHPLSTVAAAGSPDLAVRVVTRPRFRSFGSRTLLALAEAPDGATRAFSCPLPAVSRGVTIRNARDGSPLAGARFSGSPWRGELVLPRSLLAGYCRLFVKLERRFGFFDEAGWLEVSLPSSI